MIRMNLDSDGSSCIHHTKAFLRFFIAICYGAFGQAAHTHSCNKLAFLSLTQQAFAFAKSALPFPYSSNENGSNGNLAISSMLTDLRSDVSVEAKQIVPPTTTFKSSLPTTSLNDI